MFFQKKKKEEISRTEPGYEEHGERRTPWTGVFLLIIMFIAGLFFGWRALDDLARVPASPESLSYCSEEYRAADPQYYGTTLRSPLADEAQPLYKDPYGYEPEKCNFNDLEVAAGIPALDEQKRAIDKSLRESLRPDREALDVASRKREQAEAAYNLRLQERQADVVGQTEKTLTELQQQFELALSEESKFAAAYSEKLLAAKTGHEELKALREKFLAAYRPVFAEQNTRLRWYEFQVFLLQLLFVLPFFFIALRIYLKQLKKNSPYAIIFTAVVAVAGVLLLRVILTWFWDLFLARLLEVIWRWIQNFEILRSIVFYAGMVLSFAIFGGAVYYLQKRIFDPARLAIRRFRQKQCPQCQTNLDLAEMFCPNCGHHVREQCPACGKSRFIELPHCPHCGVKK